MSKILFLVECYWGSGHMNVTAELARAFTNQGNDVAIAASQSSFEIGRNFDYGTARKLVRPGLTRDKDGRAVLSDRGIPIENDAAFRQKRADVVKQDMVSTRPDALFVEAWPFGLDRFDAEFTDLLGFARKQGIPVYGVARDVLGYPEARSNPLTGQTDRVFHDVQAVAYANAMFDGLYIASDPRVSKLEDSLAPQAFAALRIPLRYVGYIGANDMPARRTMPESQRPVIVSGGGTYKGVVRTHMQQMVGAMVEAKPCTSLAENPLFIVIGAEAGKDDMDDLASIVRPLTCKVEIHRSLPSAQFRQHISDAALFLGKGSRNATVECAQALLQGPVAQLISPMRDDDIGVWPETDIRAQAFERAGLSVTLDGSWTSDPESFASAIEKALGHARQKAHQGFGLELSGARQLAADFQNRHAAPLVGPACAPE